MPKKYPPKQYKCPWCNELKPINEMRHPSVVKGKAPTTCAACRESHPDQSWCDYHNEPHSIDSFQVVKRPIPYLNICRKAAVIKNSEAANHPDIHCVSCGKWIKSWNFRGGRQKAVACRDCEALNTGKRWCLDCDDWIADTEFNRTGVGGKFWTTRCRLCRNAQRHGVTVKMILERQGSSVPECAACGTREGRISVDHDHDHCPESIGCPECVRGYLCHECNTAEGLLHTADRARMLMEYMSRIAPDNFTKIA